VTARAGARDRATLATRAEALLAAHHGERPLVLPNAWDVVSAKAVEAAGFGFVATSSRAIGDSLGEPDNDSSDPDLIFDVLGRIARAVGVPVSADLQAGLQLEPEELVGRMLAAGLVGCNLEDTDHHGPPVLVDAERQAEYLAAVRAAAEARGVHIVINARVDSFVRKVGDDARQLAEALSRGRLYLEAGADCVYPIALADTAAIARLVGELPGPINIIARRGGLTVPQLASLGVRRISMGAGIHQLAMADLGARLGRIAVGEGLAEIWPAD
jgi:2-methylisocitrate lyase-like PEP mutase family enzyme